MTLKSRDITNLLDPKGTTAGAALFHRSRSRRHGQSITEAQRTFLDAVRASKRPTVSVPAHPEAGATREQYRRDPDVELSAVELAWLDRLPRDPSQVRFEDAERLAALAAHISTMKAPQSARLVESVWGPVKALHDRRVAAARLEAAKQELPEVPAQAQAALTDALAAEHPGVSPEALRVQAREMLENVRTSQADQRATAVERAQRRVDELTQAEADHAALTRDVVVA